MSQPASILEEIRDHFARYDRPADYIDRAHCCECEEHYIELLDVTVDSIGYVHVENPGWDPTCFLSPAGFRHYFPGLARIADGHPDHFLEALAMRLSGHYVELFTAEERDLVRRLLEHWWTFEDISEWDRRAVERALGHYLSP